MPRSPSDATRFTSTGPYVSTKPPSNATSFASNPNTAPPFGAAAGTSATQLKLGGRSAPSNETPQQKIARLRAAAQLAKQGKESSFDKTVRIGRVWADRAHRVTAISLIGLTVVSAAVATAGITDMLLHNRRRRNEWLAEKQAESARELLIARRDQAQGTATEDQLLLINRARAAFEAEEAKKNRPGMFKRASNWLFSGLSKEEQKGGRLGAVAAGGAQTALDETREAASTIVDQGKGVLRTIEDKVDTHRRPGEMVENLMRPAGGPLDRQAQLVVDSASQTWKSWFSGR